MGATLEADWSPLGPNVKMMMFVYDDGDQKIQGKQGNDADDQNNYCDDDDGSQPRRLTGRLSIPISRRNVSESGHLLE